MESRLCWYKMRGGPCKLERYHKGRHSTVANKCTKCPAIVRSKLMPGDVCFLCYMQGERSKEVRRRYRW